jgi:hypothetical protein
MENVTVENMSTEKRLYEEGEKKTSKFESLIVCGTLTV